MKASKRDAAPDQSNDTGAKETPKMKVGGMIITNRGYGGGSAMDELIGAKKVTPTGA